MPDNINPDMRIQVERAAKQMAMATGQAQNLLTDGKGFQVLPSDQPIPDGWRLLNTFEPGFDL